MVKIVVNYSGYLELVVDLPLWKMMEFVSWDDDIPSIGKQNVPHHQSAYQLCMMVPSSYSWFIPSFSHLSISQLNAIANRTGGPIPYDSHFWQMDHHLPSGKRLHSYWKWPFIVDLPIKNGTFIVDLHVPLHVGKITTCSFLYGSHLPTWFSDADRKKNKTWGHKTLFKSHMYSFQSASEINLQFSQKKIWIGQKKKVPRSNFELCMKHWGTPIFSSTMAILFIKIGTKNSTYTLEHMVRYRIPFTEQNFPPSNSK